MAQVVFRMAKLKDAAGIGRVGRHNNRTDGYSHVDPDGPAPITVMGGDGDLVALVTDRIGDQKVRSNGVMAVELVLSASPDYFRPDAPESWGKYDQTRLDDWVASQKKFLTDTFGAANVVNATLHLDEATPHIHVVIVPIRETDGKLTATHWFDGVEKMRGMQDSAGKAVKHLGIRRGEIMSAAEHKDHKKFYTAANSDTPKLPPVTMKKPKDLPPATMAERIPLTAASAARGELEAQYEAKVATWKAQITANREAKIKAYPVIVEQAKAAKMWEAEAKEATKTATHYRQLADGLADQTAQLKKIPLVDLLVGQFGATEDGTKEGQVTRKFVVGDNRIAVTGDLWIDNASNGKGRGAIDLVMHITGRDFKSAVHLIRDQWGSDRVIADVVQREVGRVKAEIERIPDAPPPPPPESKRNWEAVKDYLVTARRIPAEVVDYLHGIGKVYANKLSQIVFPREKGGFAARGIDDTIAHPFKQTVGKAAECGGYVIPGPGDVYICEGTIDAVSIKAVHRDAYVIATLGVRGIRPDQATVPVGRLVHIAFDNDAPGDEAAAIWMKVYKEADRVRPAGKDWNDDLKRGAAIDQRWSPEPDVVPVIASGRHQEGMSM